MLESLVFCRNIYLGPKYCTLLFKKKNRQHDIRLHNHQGHLPDGRKVAVKRLIQSSLTDEGVNAFMREVGVMSKLRHGNLLQLLSYCQDGKERILVYEYMKNKSLNLYIFGT